MASIKIVNKKKRDELTFKSISQTLKLFMLTENIVWDEIQLCVYCTFLRNKSMSTAVIANLVEELKTSNDKIAKAAELEALLTSLNASIEVKDADYDNRITGSDSTLGVACIPPTQGGQLECG